MADISSHTSGVAVVGKVVGTVVGTVVGAVVGIVVGTIGFAEVVAKRDRLGLTFGQENKDCFF